MPPEGERLVVGLVRGLHGLDGTVRVEPLSDDAARFEPGARLYPEGSTRRLTVEWAQADAPGLLVRFREVQTREAADRLRGVYLEAVAPVADLGPDEYWWHEVIGVPVTTGRARRSARSTTSSVPGAARSTWCVGDLAARCWSRPSGR